MSDYRCPRCGAWAPDRCLCRMAADVRIGSRVAAWRFLRAIRRTR